MIYFFLTIVRFLKLYGFAMFSEDIVSINNLIFNLTAFLGELFGADKDLPW